MVPLNPSKFGDVPEAVDVVQIEMSALHAVQANLVCELRVEGMHLLLASPQVLVFVLDVGGNARDFNI